MDRLFERYWFVLVGLALVLDAAIIFGPPLFREPELPQSTWVLLPARWLVMMTLAWLAYRAGSEDYFTAKQLKWMAFYAIFGFTLAGILNGYFSGV